jgi:citrate lyase subunit beta / citryl-CoA lyase
VPVPAEVVRRIDTARSLLFVPADRPDRVGKALAAGADGVIVDLEDAVRAAHRPAARHTVAALAYQAADGGDALVLVRVNAFGSDDFPDDVRAAIEGRVAGIVVPKFDARDAADLDRSLSALESLNGATQELALVGLVETAAGMLSLSCTPDFPRRLRRLAFGAADFHADLGTAYTVKGAHAELALAMLVWASAAARIAAPLDTPHFAIDDNAGLSAAAGRSAALGYGGKLCIHPRQVALVHAAFRIDPEQRAWAANVLAQWDEQADGGAGALRVRGELVDEAMVRRARRIAAAP